MTLTVNATYENGTLKLDRPLPLKEHEQVRVTVEPARGLTEQTTGMIGWKGDVETFERILKEAEETQYLRSSTTCRLAKVSSWMQTCWYSTSRLILPSDLRVPA